MRTDDELRAGWQLFTDKQMDLYRQGTLHSTFCTMRVDTQADGGMVTNMVVYNLSEDTHLAMLAYQLQSVHDRIHQGNSANFKHCISRVLNLFLKLFQARAQVTGLHPNLKKDLN